MKNIIYFIVIFFWILSMISKSKKKQQQTAELDRIRNLNKRVAQRKENEPLTQREVPALFEMPSQKIDYETAYASNDYSIDEKRSEDSLTESEHEDVSHFQKNIGMASSLGTESSEEKEAYDKDIPVIPQFTFGNRAIRQYVIASEILGKPKALRR